MSLEVQHKKDSLEVVCIEVKKVYDFCYKPQEKEITISIPAHDGHPPEPVGTTVKSCEVIASACQEIARQKRPDGLFNVTILLTVTIAITLLHPDGTEFSFTHSLGQVETIVLYAPDGTEIQCEAVGANCHCIILPDLSSVFCTVNICKIIQAKAQVKLLIPSYGFCYPALCEQVPPPPPPPCPPELFPPQLVL